MAEPAINALSYYPYSQAVKDIIPELDLQDDRWPPNACWISMRLLNVVDPWVEAKEGVRLRPVLNLIEQCQWRGTSDVENDVCTCLLESLSNALGWTNPDLKPWFRDLLGPRSRAFWDAWNEL